MRLAGWAGLAAAIVLAGNLVEFPSSAKLIDRYVVEFQYQRHMQGEEVTRTARGQAFALQGRVQHAGARHLTGAECVHAAHEILALDDLVGREVAGEQADVGDELIGVVVGDGLPDRDTAGDAACNATGLDR